MAVIMADNQRYSFPFLEVGEISSAVNLQQQASSYSPQLSNLGDGLVRINPIKFSGAIRAKSDVDFLTEKAKFTGLIKNASECFLISGVRGLPLGEVLSFTEDMQRIGKDGLSKVEIMVSVVDTWQSLFVKGLTMNLNTGVNNFNLEYDANFLPAYPQINIVGEGLTRIVINILGFRMIYQHITPLAAGETLIIDAMRGTVIRGTVDVSSSILDGGEMPTIHQSGSSYFDIVGINTGTATINYRERYL